MEGSDLDLVRASLDAFNRRDADAILALADPDVEWVPMRSGLDGSTYRGGEGLRRYLAEIDDEWEHLEVEVDELLPAGPGRVVVLGYFQARGRASGIELHMPGAWVCDLRAGRVLRMRAYGDRGTALSEAGLTPG